MNKLKHSLRGYLVTYLLPLIIVGSCSMSWWFYQNFDKSSIQEITTHINNDAQQISFLINQHITTQLKELSTFTKKKVVKNLLVRSKYQTTGSLQKKLINNFKALRKKTPSFSELYLIKENKIITLFNEDLFYLPSTDKQWILNNKNTTKTTIIKTEHGYRLIYRSPILNSYDDVIGQLIFTENMSFLRKINDFINYKGDERIVYYTPLLGVLPPTDTLNKTLFNLAKYDVYSQWYQGYKHFWLLKRQTNKYLNFYVFHNNKQYKATLTRVKRQTVLLTLVVIIVFTIVFWFILSTFIICPIKEASMIATSIADGNFSTQLKINRLDEVGDLLRSLSRMSKKLNINKKHVEQLVYYDQLTGIRNKQYFIEKLKTLPVNNNKHYLTVLFIDLNNFKQVNNIHGYNRANKLLTAISKELSNIIKSYLTQYKLNSEQLIFARDGADVFSVACYLPKDPIWITQFIKKTQEQLLNSIWIDAVEFNIGTTIGWQQASKNTQSKELLKQAMMALHEAKQKKAGITQFNQTLIDQVIYNQTLSNNINKALENNEFELFYQPKKDLRDGSVHEFEALIRWFHPTDGFINPGEFIPFAEQANLIKDIDYWVLTQTTLDIHRMEALGFSNFIVSFNVSSNRLSDSTFITLLKSQIIRLKIQPKHIQIEITEHSFIRNLAESIVIIKELKALGLSIALDDFGTGTSSLQYLKDLPIDTLKIDKCFITNADQDKHMSVILKNIINLGKSLNLQIIGEGVETATEYQLLTELGCDTIQGYSNCQTY